MTIEVEYQPSHWITGEEDTDFWYCQHPEDAIDTDDVVRFHMGMDGARTYEDTITVCRSCGGWLGDDGIWQDCECPEVNFNTDLQEKR